MPVRLLTPADVRGLAQRLDIVPSKSRGQNFVVDPGTVTRIAASAGVSPGSQVLEVGPGLGSLTLALLATGASVTAVEIDGRLAAALPDTVAQRAPDDAGRLAVVGADALTLQPQDLLEAPTDLVANLPYNVAVPVVLTLLARFESIERVLVMVQLEVAERLAAGPGSRTYGGPSVKARWYGDVALAGLVKRAVFWPVPRVDSALVRITRTRRGDPERRAATFAAIDAAFAQRRKTLRAALATWAGSADGAAQACRAAGVDPGARGEALTLADFERLAEHRPAAGGAGGSAGATRGEPGD